MKFSFTVRGEIEVPDGTRLIENRSDCLQLEDGSVLELDVTIEPSTLVEEKNIPYALSFMPVFEEPSLAIAHHKETNLRPAKDTPIQNSHPLGLVNSELFEHTISIMSHLGSSNSLVYNFIFRDDRPWHSSYVAAGSAVYTPQEVEQIKERYIRMVKAIDQFLAKGFKIKELELIGIKNNQGTKLRYVTPNGRLHTQEYIRTEGPEAMIPDDFLHDLEHIPSRSY